MQLLKVQSTAKARRTGGRGPLARCLVALFTAAVSLILNAVAFAQQPAQTAGQNQGVAAIAQTRTGNVMTQCGNALSTDANAIRPFRFHISQEALDDLRRHIAATQWPEKEIVADMSQGLPLATMQKLARYWATDYDWRKVEAKLDALPQFITNIDGLDIHFINVRSKNSNALPVIITHGWPGSIIEQLKIIDPLVNPTAHGGRAEDSFDVVIPSMPGYSFSGKPTAKGWGVERMARATTRGNINPD